MNHSLRVEILTYGPFDTSPTKASFVQAIDSLDFDPENRTLGVLAGYGWDELVHKTYLGSILQDAANEGAPEDDRVVVYFDGEPLVDEALRSAGTDLLNERWVAKHEVLV